jgi:RHH-type proline utilization regulon transcriptional repressor/proline dehydrogenase/delta 1-pyrroline-5-carboxylate dehydrogenase
MPREIFGPVLHVASFKAGEVEKVVASINATGYGLTFGLHSRIDDRVQSIVSTVKAGNIYVNRNQIGAVVGSQPFGGEGLSGTGPKAGGPHYLSRFTRTPAPEAQPDATITAESSIAVALSTQAPAQQGPTQALPGPTGESNRLTSLSRPPVLCLGPGQATAETQAAAIRALGGHAILASGVAPAALNHLQGFSGALWWGDTATARTYAQALAQRQGPILPLITDTPDAAHAMMERHICIDTTASGGNAQLLAEAGA